jgi:hypothetical protein
MDNLNVPNGWRVRGRGQGGRNFADSKEAWKKWKNSPYEISNKGRVRRKEADGSYNMRKPRDDDRKHLRVNLTWDGHREEPMLHQCVMELFGPPKPKGENIVILHKDDDGTNNAISNLKWGTRSENVQSAHDNGLIKKGSSKK